MAKFKFALSFLTFLIISFHCNTQVLQITYETPEEVGRISSPRINEASGMAFSYTTNNAFWTHNDSGDGPNLYLVSKSGELLTLGNVTGASSNDWEDMASFQVNGKSYLIIGDFGDNPRTRTSYKLYIIEEPNYNPDGNNPSSYPILRTINYTYDNGSQNCESIGIDTTLNKIILFSKSHDNEVRYVYEMPLSVEAGSETLIAQRIASLPSNDTTAMDISNNGNRAIVLTYNDFAYEFVRENNETWQQAFNKTHTKITMPIGRAGEEAIAYDTNGIDIYTIREGVGSEIYYLKGIISDPNSPHNAEFVSQSNVPKLLEKNQTVSVSVTMKNTGTTTWTKQDLFALGSVDDDNSLGVVKVELEENEAIQPNQEKTFTFNITAPNTSGVFNFRWRMTKEDEIPFGQLSPSEKVIILASNEYLDDCDSKEGWNPSSLQLNNSDNLQGTATLEFNGTATDEFSKTFTTPYSVTGSRQDIILQFWYYVSDPTQFDTANQVEISSSGGPDTDEYNWSLSNLKSGWNFIRLPISSANRSGAPKLDAINWFRLYRFKKGNVITRLDGIQLINESTLSLQEFEKKTKINIYPVPANNKLNASITVNQSSTVILEILNALGQTISTPLNSKEVKQGQQNIEINISQLKPGVYFMRLKVKDKTSIKQFIVK